MDLAVQEDRIEAKRGYIYKFDDGKNPEDRYVLVVSDNSRCIDKLVNILMFGDSKRGRDVVPVVSAHLPEKKYLHCGMVTYTCRSYLTEELGELEPDILVKVDRMLCDQLGINMSTESEVKFYKNAYNDLLDRVLEKCSMGE